MRDLDLKLLRLLRTRGHTPALEDAAKFLGKAGNNGLGWLLAGGALAAVDARRRPAPPPRRAARPRTRPGRNRAELRDKADCRAPAPGAQGPAATRRRAE